MKANASIVAALGELQAAMAAPACKEWLANRKEVGRRIDPEAVDVVWQYSLVLDPYECCEHVPDQLRLIGREYFARSLEADDWVVLEDLPKSSRDKLWRRLRAGHFDTNDRELTRAVSVLGFDLNGSFFRPTRSQTVSYEGRVAVRTRRKPGVPLIVKPADPEDMIYQLVTLEGLGTAHLNGWISARTAKRQFPLLSVGDIAAHFVEQDNLRSVRDLEMFLRQSA